MIVILKLSYTYIDILELRCIYIYIYINCIVYYILLGVYILYIYIIYVDQIYWSYYWCSFDIPGWMHLHDYSNLSDIQTVES